jgi:hypothetical protein
MSGQLGNRMATRAGALVYPWLLLKTFFEGKRPPGHESSDRAGHWWHRRVLLQIPVR